MSKDKTPKLSRRAFLGGTAAAAGLLLRGVATGLPPAWLIAPETAFAQAGGRMPQTLIFSTSSAGDPVNINCPGSYVNGVVNNPIMPTAMAQFGEQRVRAAAPWTELPTNLRRRMGFFHLRTHAAAHTEHDDTMTMRGAVKGSSGNGREMFPSMIGQATHEQLGTFQKEPLVLGNARITFESQPIQTTKPTELKSLFSGSMDALNDLRVLRDNTLDQIYARLRQTGTQSQMSFLEQFINGRDTARSMGNDLGQYLNDLPINDEEPNSVEDQIIAAVALARLQVSPVIVVNIPFGRDNHQDSDLSQEAQQTVRGVNSLGLLWRELQAANLQDSVSFAMLNVFGRTFRPNNRGGRDHNRHHGVMVAFGPHVQGGVYGGVNSNGQCRNIRPGNGRPTNSGGISAEDTMQTAGKSMAAALGVPNNVLNDRIQGGRVLRPFLRTA